MNPHGQTVGRTLHFPQAASFCWKSWKSVAVGSSWLKEAAKVGTWV